MTIFRTHRFRAIAAALAAGLIAALMLNTSAYNASASPAPAGNSQNVRSTPDNTKPTIVLVHGAFADSTGWNEVAAH